MFRMMMQETVSVVHRLETWRKEYAFLFLDVYFLIHCCSLHSWLWPVFLVNRFKAIFVLLKSILNCIIICVASQSPHCTIPRKAFFLQIIIFVLKIFNLDPWREKDWIVVIEMLENGIVGQIWKTVLERLMEKSTFL